MSAVIAWKLASVLVGSTRSWLDLIPELKPEAAQLSLCSDVDDDVVKPAMAM